MRRPGEPPVRALKIVGALFGATALGSTGWQHWKKPGLGLGILAGLAVGWIVAWWITRELFGD